MKKRGLPEAGRVLRIPVEAIVPNPAQPRRVFDEEALGELAESIARYGILQPLSVRRVEKGYELVAGERRLRAARLAGLAEVPCLTEGALFSSKKGVSEDIQMKDKPIPPAFKPNSAARPKSSLLTVQLAGRVVLNL